MPGARAEASKRVRDAIVEATVRIVARSGVAAVTHRRVAEEAGVSLSSTTWHFASKADILAAALRWCADREIARIEAIADRLAVFELDAWADALADWLIEQVRDEHTIALYRLQIELLGTPRARAVHREWGRGLRSIGDRVLDGSHAADVRLVIAALDGLRLSALSAGETDLEWLRPVVRRQLEALLG